MKTAIVNVRVYDFKNYLENHFVVFDRQILIVAPMSEFVDEGYKIIDGKNMLLMPGLICAHTHLYSMLARGLSLPFNPKNFQEILDQMWWKLDRHIDNETTYYSGVVGAHEFLLNGVTTIIDHHASGLNITGSLASLKKSVCDLASMRAIMAFEVSDRFDVNKAIKENINYIKRFKTPYTAGLFGLHASSSLSEQTLLQVQKVLKDIPIHIHVAESEMDQEDCQSKYKMRVVERLHRHQLINENSLLVHCVHVNDQEIEIIRKTGAKVVANITSNMNNAVGLPNLVKFKQRGIPVFIGNDGLSTSIANEYLNVVYGMHLHGKKPTNFGLVELTEMINDAYMYVSLLLNIKLGRIEPTYEADLLLVPYIPITPVDNTNILGHVFYGLMNSFKPKDVFVGGKRLVKDYVSTNKKLILEYEKAQGVAEQLWARIQGEK
ncbi:MAG: amidohydrolase family protein [Bacilli bacterium]|jgi:cytosine/adenosine deaminase-related metal-dependent hydrolase